MESISQMVGNVNSDPSVFDNLVGKHVKGISYASRGEAEHLSYGDGDTRISIALASGEVYTYLTEGDCCNSVFVEAIENSEALADAIVTRTESGVCDSIVSGSFENCDVVEAGFWRIYTNKGTCTIEVRNSHNGYYGGNVVRENPK